jgi:ADP-ribose pyrophosphatase YjhB (NUDIX family)
MTISAGYPARRRTSTAEDADQSFTRRDLGDSQSADWRREDREDRPARPMVAVDTVLFAVHEARLKAYLVQLDQGSLRGKWAFPGGLVRAGEVLDDAARRELRASTGLIDSYLEQLFTFGDPNRDPRSHVVSVAYMALVPDAALVQPPPSDKYQAGKWFEVAALPPLAYDHALMAQLALSRLKAKVEYTNIAYALLPQVFTFAEFEHFYSVVLQRPVDRRNFRRKIMAMGLLRRLPSKRRGAHRPAALYRFAERSLQIVRMI